MLHTLSSSDLRTPEPVRPKRGFVRWPRRLGECKQSVHVRCLPKGVPEEPLTRTSETSIFQPRKDFPNADIVEQRVLGEKQSSQDLAFKRVQNLQCATSLKEAINILADGVQNALQLSLPYKSGLVRLEVSLPGGICPLRWLRCQSHLAHKMPSTYFSPRQPSAPSTKGTASAEKCLKGWGAVAALGAAREWKGKEGSLDSNVVDDMLRFLSPSNPQIRVFGGTRFDADVQASSEWTAFGSFMFLLPSLELAESPNGLHLSCNVAWGPESQTRYSTVMGTGPQSPSDAVEKALELIREVSTTINVARPLYVGESSVEHFPGLEDWQKMVSNAQSIIADVSTSMCEIPSPSLETLEQGFMERGQKGLDDLLSAMTALEFDDQSQVHLRDMFVKVVLARRTDRDLSGIWDPWDLLSALQARDPKGYQISLSVPGGGCFIGCTPERLYGRSNEAIALEAVAGTRPRGPDGDVERDFWLGLDLLQSCKDHTEYSIVMEWLKKSAQKVCDEVTVEVPKTLLKQASVQHLYGKLFGKLKDKTNDADILATIHPTPAVCGCPSEKALEFIREHEPFDRGYYAGPFGWISGQGAEFVVAIRSALVAHPDPRNGSQPSRVVDRKISLYAGVGVVHDSDIMSEWKELDLKVNQYARLFASRLSPLEQPNMNLAWTAALVEELCRLGISTFGVAPGSRSSPLAIAVASHPQTTIVPCIDERSLGFWALGYARATGLPAPVITSSGTAVANLLPAVVEASMSNIPMLLLTADRPPELRDCGANQSIDQVKIFGDYVQRAYDLPAPGNDIPLRLILTTIDDAYLHSRTQPGGPVHLNLQFREPLSPAKTSLMHILDSESISHWWTSGAPFTSPINIANTHVSMPSPDSLSEVLAAVSGANRCLLVVGEMKSPEDVAAAKRIAQVLRWPVVTDVLSGCRFDGTSLEHTVLHADHILLDKDHVWPALRPDAVLQIGGHLTSKRLATFLEWSATSPREIPMKWIFAGQNLSRDDPVHLITHKLFAHLQDLCPSCDSFFSEPRRNFDYLHTWEILNQTVELSISKQMKYIGQRGLSEPLVAYTLSKILPPGHQLFLGNSMPIRDMDSYASGVHGSLEAVVGANRGASGIDGVVSTTAGFASGLGKPVTLLIGDVSFLHDTNGLLLLTSRPTLPPVTIILVNNSGGGIFSFLPIADSVEPDMFNLLWATPQTTNIEGICQAHGVLHQKVNAVGKLESALKMAWRSNSHSVVEVVTDRTSNVDIHREIQQAVKEPTKKALDFIQGCNGQKIVIDKVTWRKYSLPLNRPLTTGQLHEKREGFIISVTLAATDGQQFIGFGDVCPLPTLHSESIEDVSRQIASVGRLLEESQVPFTLALLQGGFDEWFRMELGVCGSELHSSLRFGIEMAIYTALMEASGQGSSAFRSPDGGNTNGRSIEICGLIDPCGDMESGVSQSKELVAKGYETLKIKVARELSPEQDAIMVTEIRDAVGEEINLRCDANRGWSYEDAVRFGTALKGTKIEYVEEPFEDVELIPSFSEHSGLTCALDETLERVWNEHGRLDSILELSGVTCWVVKPSLLGSIDSVASLARLARLTGCSMVISSAFESSLGLALLGMLAHMTDHLTGSSIAHGLGTAMWFGKDLIAWEAIELEESLLKKPFLDLPGVWNLFSGVGGGDWMNTGAVGEVIQVQSLRTSWWDSGNFSFCVSEGSSTTSVVSTSPPVLFLHGFMGSGSDWWPVVDFLLDEFRCITIDLPGHGSTLSQSCNNWSVESVASSLLKCLEDRGIQDCVLVGYSLGARIALQMAVLANKAKRVRISSVLSVSGSAGLSDAVLRENRAWQDDALARTLDMGSLDTFVEQWYQGPLWVGLRHRKGVFRRVLERRRGLSGVNSTETITERRKEYLSFALSALSLGRMEPLQASLPKCRTHFLFMSGSEDQKFCRIARKLAKEVNRERKGSVNGSQSAGPSAKYVAQMLEIPNCSHAMHLERPLQVAEAIRYFLLMYS